MKLNAILLAFPLLLAAGASNAATSAQLQVKGTIIAPSCDVSLSGGGRADFDEIPRSTLNSGTTVSLGSRLLQADVTCTALTAVALKFSDNRTTGKPQSGNMNVQFENVGSTGADVALGIDNIFGLGLASNNEPIGGYAIRVGKASVTIGAGTPAVQTHVGYSITGAANTWYAAADQHNVSHSYPYIMATNASAQYINGEKFSFPLDIAASLNLSGKIPGAADVPLNGEAILEVIYL